MKVMRCLICFVMLAIVTGVVYPLFMTLVGHLFMKEKVGGSLIVREGKVIGSRLIGQKFVDEKYFWPRPSFVDYNPLPSNGSNFGPTSLKLKESVESRKKTLGNANVPSDLLFASGSGLDPHITPKAAYFQVKRIAAKRNRSESELDKLIDSLTEERTFSFLGMPRVNVLLLNLALDEMEK